MVYSNNSGDTSPTRPQSVGGNYSPASALKPRLKHTSHLQLYSSICTNSYAPRAIAQGRSNMLLIINHTITCPLCWHHNYIYNHLSFPSFHTSQNITFRISHICGQLSQNTSVSLESSRPTPAQPASCSSRRQSSAAGTNQRSDELLD